MKKVVVVLFVLLMVVGSASAQWETHTSQDEMTGEKTCYASTPWVGPTQAMSFPNHNTEASMVLAVYPSGREKVYFAFTSSPNLTGGDISDGSNSYRVRVRWGDDSPEYWGVNQSWGSRFLEFHSYYTKKAIAGIQSHSSFMIALPWYWNNGVIFKFSLDGSTSAIEQAREMCGK